MVQSKNFNNSYNTITYEFRRKVKVKQAKANGKVKREPNTNQKV